MAVHECAEITIFTPGSPEYDREGMAIVRATFGDLKVDMSVDIARAIGRAGDIGEGDHAVTEHQPLPVKGYTSQSDAKVDLVNINKQVEERLLRQMDTLKDNPEVDQRWLAIARTGIEKSFMALNRAIFQPQRITLPED